MNNQLSKATVSTPVKMLEKDELWLAYMNVWVNDNGVAVGNNWLAAEPVDSEAIDRILKKRTATG